MAEPVSENERKRWENAEVEYSVMREETLTRIRRLRLEAAGGGTEKFLASECKSPRRGVSPKATR